MLCIDEPVPGNRIADYEHLDRYFRGQRIMMFDIETTGLSAANSFTYLIGMNIRKEDGWHIIQLFNDDGKSEPEMISQLQETLSRHDLLVEFNGDTFDIPYITKRMHSIRLHTGRKIPDHFPEIPTLDLMKVIRPYKNALGLPNIRQKTLEEFLGIRRQDIYNGGQLIGVYLRYLRTGNPGAKADVLRHNRDDMEGMLFVSSVLAYRAAAEGHFQVTGLSMQEKGEELQLTFSCQPEFPLPEPFHTELPESLSAGTFSLSGEVSSIILSVPVFCGTLRFFYPDSKIPEEKKSFFVSGLSRDLSGLHLPLYRENLRSREQFLELTDSFLNVPQQLQNYAAAVITALLEQKKTDRRK